jgi:hypothetical protein
MFSTQDWRYLQLRGGQLVVPLAFATIHVAFFGDSSDSPSDTSLARRRRMLLVFIGWLGMVSYQGASLLLPIHLAGVAGLLLAWKRGGSPLDRRRAIEPVFTAIGLALGLTLNPYMDARASTWRFAAYHVLNMGSDTARLYEDLEVAEFHGFPLVTFAENPEWGVLLALAIIGLCLVGLDLWRKRPVPRDIAVIAPITLVCILLTAKAMRVREYAVPLVFVFFALLARGQQALPRFTRVTVGALVGGLAFFGLVQHWLRTSFLIDQHLPTDEYAGARPLLDLNGDRPILNIAEADYCMLKWQKPDVVCVQGLSRYFLYPNRAIYKDVWELHDRALTSSDTIPILRRFYDRGVRLVATHGKHSLAAWAREHPEVLVPLFTSPTGNGAVLWGIDPSGFRRGSRFFR